MSDRRTRWRDVTAGCGALTIGLLLLSGCNAGEGVRESKLYDRIVRDGGFHSASPPAPGRLAAVGRDAITSECEHESYANARKGLVVGETGLHEDVFALRDRVSFAANAYGMDEALRLEALLHGEAKTAGRSAEQVKCINLFAEHLESLTDALAQADKLQKELDFSAFTNSQRQAEEQQERRQREIEQSGAPNPR